MNDVDEEAECYAELAALCQTMHQLEAAHGAFMRALAQDPPSWPSLKGARRALRDARRQLRDIANQTETFSDELSGDRVVSALFVQAERHVEELGRALPKASVGGLTLDDVRRALKGARTHLYAVASYNVLPEAAAELLQSHARRAGLLNAQG